ncbi:MAG: EthD family reductase [Bacteroidota bacterium]
MKKMNLAAPYLLLSVVLLAGCAATKSAPDGNMASAVKLMVLYPQPTDVEKFELDYVEHLKLLHEKANIAEDAPLPYTVTRFAPTPDGPPPYYQLFTMHYSSAEALQQARSSLGEVAADAVRISSGGAPIVMIGSDTP